MSVDLTRPKPPIFPSTYTSDLRLQYWIGENEFESLADASGFQWVHTIHSFQTRSKEDSKRLIWTVFVELFSESSSKELVAGKVLDVDRDSRMLEMIGNEQIRFQAPLSRVSANSSQELRSAISTHFLDLRLYLRSRKFNELKRSQVFEWVDRVRHFGWRAKKQETQAQHLRHLISFSNFSDCSDWPRVVPHIQQER